MFMYFAPYSLELFKQSAPFGAKKIAPGYYLRNMTGISRRRGSIEVRRDAGWGSLSGRDVDTFFKEGIRHKHGRMWDV